MKRPLIAVLWAVLAMGTGCATTGGSGGKTRGGQTGTSSSTKNSTGKDGPNTRAQLLFDDAIKALETQRKNKTPNDDALARKFEAVLSADGSFAEAEYNLGVLAERRGKRDEAARHYQAALRTKPSLRQAADNLAVIQQNNGDVVGAVSSYSEILRKHPEDPASRSRLADLYRLSGDHDKAMELAKAALIRDPKWEPAYRVMMRSYLDRKQVSMARLVALRALKLDESDPELYYGLGMALLEEKQPEKAFVQFEKAVAVRHDYLPARIALAKISLQRENYLAAEGNLKSFLALEPKSAEAHVDLGIAYKGQGQFDKAMQEYDAAEKINPDLAPIYLNRGIILHRHKDAPERGIEYYKKYIALSGGDVALPVDAPVFALLKEAEGVVQMKKEMERQEQETKKMEEAQKLQEKNMKAAEEEEKKKAGSAPAGTSGSKKPKPAPSDEPETNP